MRCNISLEGEAETGWDVPLGEGEGDEDEFVVVVEPFHVELPSCYLVTLLWTRCVSLVMVEYLLDDGNTVLRLSSNNIDGNIVETCSLFNDKHAVLVEG